MAAMAYPLSGTGQSIKCTHGLPMGSRGRCRSPLFCPKLGHRPCADIWPKRTYFNLTCCSTRWTDHSRKFVLRYALVQFVVGCSLLYLPLPLSPLSPLSLSWPS